MPLGCARTPLLEWGSVTCTASVTVCEVMKVKGRWKGRMRRQVLRNMTAHLESGAMRRDGAVHVPGPGVGGQPDEKLPNSQVWRLD